MRGGPVEPAPLPDKERNPQPRLKVSRRRATRSHSPKWWLGHGVAGSRQQHRNSTEAYFNPQNSVLPQKGSTPGRYLRRRPGTLMLADHPESSDGQRVAWPTGTPRGQLAKLSIFQPWRRRRVHLSPAEVFVRLKGGNLHIVRYQARTPRWYMQVSARTLQAGENW